MNEILQISTLKGLGCLIALRLIVPILYAIWWVIIYRRVPTEYDINDNKFELLKLCLTFINFAILFEMLWFIIRVIKLYL